MKNTKESIRDTEYTRSMTRLRGMDTSGKRTERSFFYLENMYVNYEGGGSAVESIPGFRKIFSPKEEMHSIGVIGASNGKKALIVHAGKHLYRLSASERDSLNGLSQVAELPDSKSRIFCFGSLGFVADGEGLWLIDAEGEVTRISSSDRLAACTNAAIYDGRLFLSGNEKYPSLIFYSTKLSEGKIEFPPENLLTEGSLGIRIMSLLSFGGFLWIFKATDDGDGSIVCRGGEGYPVKSVFSGLTVCSNAVAFDGKIHFLSDAGLMTVEEPMCPQRSKIKCSSNAICSMLSGEMGENALLGTWLGYLAVCFGGRIYLADAREGGGEYDWYFINGIGEYAGERRVYKYTTAEQPHCLIHPCPHSPAKGEIMSAALADGGTIYYSEEEGGRFGVYPTEEMTDGDFCPAENYAFDQKYLWFSAGNSVCLFNNDKSADSFPAFYSFAGHAIRYAAITHYDDCAMPATAKSSPPDSLLLELSALSGGKFDLSVMADGEKKSERQIQNPSKAGKPIVISERNGTWYKKQLCFVSEEFCSPFGIKAFSFRHRPKIRTNKT